MGGQNAIDSKLARLRLELKSSVFTPGQKISGKIHMQVLKAFTPTALFVKFHGYEKTQWQQMYFEDSKANTDASVPRMSSITAHHDKLTIVTKTFPVCEWDSEIIDGGHTIPFKLTLPETLPGSLYYHHHPIKAEIFYEIVVFMNSPIKISSRLPITIRQPQFSLASYKIDPPVTSIRSFCVKNKGISKISVKLPSEVIDPSEDLNFSIEVDNTQSKMSIKGMKWQIYYMITIKEPNRKDFISCRPLLGGKIKRKVKAGELVAGENAIEVTVKDFAKYASEYPVVKGRLVEGVVYVMVSGVMDTLFSCFASGAQVMAYLPVGPCFQKERVVPQEPDNWNPIKYHTVLLEDQYAGLNTDP